MRLGGLATFLLGLVAGGILVTAVLSPSAGGPSLQLCPLPPAATQPRASESTALSRADGRHGAEDVGL